MANPDSPAMAHPEITRVAVTGSTGYIGSFVVAELLSRGYQVHAPVRGFDKNPGKAAHLEKLPFASTGLTVFSGGDLEVKGSFDSAFSGCDAVIHTAAEVTLGASESIITASVTGTTNVLESVDKEPLVTRFVQTSSIAAIQTYDRPIDHVFTEADFNDWSTVEKGDAYGVAKTRAEQLVHKHFEQDSHRHAVALNPGVVIGPVMTKAHTKASPVFLREIVFGNKVMNFPSTYVDVRDVAVAHCNAMEKLPGIGGKRFILTNDTKCLPGGAMDLAPMVGRLFPDEKIVVKPKYSNAVMAIMRPLSMVPVIGSYIMSEMERKAQCLPIYFDNTRAKNELGVQFKPLEETIKDGIESMIRQDFARFKSKL